MPGLPEVGVPLPGLGGGELVVVGVPSLAGVPLEPVEPPADAGFEPELITVEIDSLCVWPGGLGSVTLVLTRSATACLFWPRVSLTGVALAVLWPEA